MATIFTRSNIKCERNAKIFIALVRGDSIKSVAEQYELNHKVVMQIFTQTRNSLYRFAFVKAKYTGKKLQEVRENPRVWIKAANDWASVYLSDGL